MLPLLDEIFHSKPKPRWMEDFKGYVQTREKTAVSLMLSHWKDGKVFSTTRMYASQNLENMRNLNLPHRCAAWRASFPLPSYGSIFTSSSLRHGEAEGIETETPSVLCGCPTCFR